MPIQFKYYSDGTIVKSSMPLIQNKRCTSNFMVSQFPDLIDRKIGSSGWLLDDNTAVSGREWIDAICKLYEPIPKKKKSYCITSKIRRKISASTAKLALSKQPGENLLFITLTFSEPINEKDSNVCWSKFVENLKENYSLTGYIGVKELHKSGVPHYHCILRMPYQELMTLNDAWCHTWPEGFKYSNCALRTDKKKGAKIKNIRRAIAYVCKYMSKEGVKGVKYVERCHFIDHSSLDSGTLITEKFMNFIFDLSKCEKKTVHMWKHPDYPTIIHTIMNFYQLYEEIMQIYIDTFT